MAKGKKTGGNDFKPGNKLGKGPTVLSPEFKKVRQMTHEDIAKIGQLILEKNVNELAEIKDDGKSLGLLAWMSAVAYRGIKTGDHNALSPFLDRVVGKVKESVSVEGKIDVTNTQVYLDNAKDAIEFLKQKGEIEDGRSEESDKTGIVETTGETIL